MPAELSLDSRICRAERQVSTRLDDVAVVLNTHTGRYYQLSPVGAAIWDKLRVPICSRTLLDELSREYEAPSETIRAEALDFVDQLHKNGLLEVATDYEQQNTR